MRRASNSTGATLRYFIFACELVLCAVFTASLSGKLRGRAAYAAFRQAVTGLTGLGVRGTGLVAPGVVAVEVLLVAICLAPGTGPVGPIAAVLTLTGFTAALARTLTRGATAPCVCFGTSGDPIQLHHLARNGILLAVAATAAAGRITEHTASMFAGLAMAQAAMVAVPALTLTTVVVRWDDVASLFTPSAGASAR